MPHRSPIYPYRRTGDLDRAETHHPVVVAGGGLVGLTLALDLARHGVRSVLLDEENTVSTGSRAICFAKRTLEIYDRLGLGERMLAKGVTWNVGKVFHRDRQVFAFDLLPEHGHHFPAFINLQQYYAEEWLAEACATSGMVDLRWRNKVVGVVNHPDHVALEIETPDGRYRITTDWLLACDGARSFIRGALDLPFVGKVFHDRFLIADVVMKADFPTERWFWFDPPFHPGQSALLHKQPDDVWRIDFQLGPDADPELERRPERVMPRVRAMLGPNAEFELEWVSVYSFRCRRLEKFVHGRTIFAGDSAHQVSPFGARGGNGGVQDADNLAWKLAAVLQGRAPASLIASYDAERIPAADENILHSTRATDFLTPKCDAARAYRDAALALAETQPFARALINSGRLSRPATLHASALHASDTDHHASGLKQGAPAIDAQVEHAGRPDWLLHHLGGPQFTLLTFGLPPAAPFPGLKTVCVSTEPTAVPAGVTLLIDHAGLVAQRYGAAPGACVLLRPDQHITACFARFDPARIATARAQALGITQPTLQEAV
jgi:3-(3-hydroxy-phenyl)propionate hydroxylase